MRWFRRLITARLAEAINVKADVGLHQTGDHLVDDRVDARLCVLQIATAVTADDAGPAVFAGGKEGGSY